MPYPPRAQGRARAALAALGAALLGVLACSACLANTPIVPLPPADPSSCVWDDAGRVVAIGDLHGDYEAFVAILRAKGLVDGGENPRWTGGTAHLVQIGDVMDRGKEARRIFVLLARLEKESAEAGGMVHFLPGNHEELNLAGLSLGYEDYVTIDQFRDFLPPASRDRHDRIVAGMNKEDREAYWKTLMSRQAEEGTGSEYCKTFQRTVGGWIIGHNVIIKINGVVFVHGGIGIADSRRSLESINAIYRRELLQASDGDIPGDRLFIFRENAPLWNRDFGNYGSSITEADVRQILSNLHARAIVVGHTPTSAASAKRFGGLVWSIDSGISATYGSQLTALEFFGAGEPVLKGVERHAPKEHPDVRRPLPGGLGDLFLRLRLASGASDA